MSTYATHGITGTWLLDPSNVTIESNGGTNVNDSNVSNVFTPNGTGTAASIVDVTNLTNALVSNNITVTTANSSGTSAGTITVSNAITWTSTFSLSLVADSTITINAAISGTSGSLNLTAVNSAQSITTGASGTISVANFNLLQGQWFQVTASLPAFSVTNNFQIASGSIPSATASFIRATGGSGTSGSPYTITDVYGLQGVGSNATTVTQSFTLAGNINASGTSTWNSGSGFAPIGSISNFYTGQFQGGGFTISNFNFTRPNGYVGMFSALNGATINNFTISGTVSCATSSACGMVARLSSRFNDQ